MTSSLGCGIWPFRRWRWDIADIAMHERSVNDRVLSCLLALYTAVLSFEILFSFGLWIFVEPDWLFENSQLTWR